jgi:hypothetical protein
VALQQNVPAVCCFADVLEPSFGTATTVIDSWYPHHLDLSVVCVIGSFLGEVDDEINPRLRCTLM